MKLKVMMKDFPAGRFLCLCDEAGEPIPNQTGASLRTDIGDVGRLTVDFVVDGEAISLAESK